MAETQRAAPIRHGPPGLITAVEWGEPATGGGVVRPGELAIGDTMGPYIVRRWLGQGGMGTVYGAEDPRLGREVALKVLHKRADDRVLQARVLREAQALARLSHPNVVPVYDVGFDNGTLWVAMELVRGPSLLSWLADEPPWTEVIDAFAQAGRGLAAAHAAGIVHRDFKPGNAMLAHADRRALGRVMVLDFGLAWAPGVEGASSVRTGESSARRSGSGRDPLAYTLTDAGAVVGTIPYMAPEQHSRREVDGRADQYSLCVSIYEGLFGTRPYDGTIETIVKKKLAGPPPRPVGTARIPGRIWRVVQRGLEPNPDDRWPDVHALVDALERGRAGARRGRRAFVAVCGVGVVGAFMSRPSAAPADPCAGLPERVARVWSPERRAAIEDAFVATGRAGARATWARTDVRIDAALMRWRDRAMAACTSAAKNADVDVAAALACADRGIAAVDGALEVLETPDDATVARSLLLVEALPRPDCAGAAGEAAEAESRRELARGRALQQAGRLRDAAELAQGVLARAHAAGDQVGVAGALLLIGGCRLDLGEYEDAESHLSDALWTAMSAGDDMLATTAATKLVHLCAMRYDPACADRWVRQAEAGLERLGERGRPLEGRLELARGDVALRAGRHDDALAHYERSLAAVVAEGGEDGLEAASIVSSFAIAHAMAGRHEQAIEEYERAAWIEEGLGGSEHTGRATKLEGIAGSLYALGRIDEARARLEEALAIVDAAYGPEHPLAVRMRGNLVLLLTESGELDRALVLAERIVAVKRKLFGAQDVQVAIALHNEGMVRGRMGQHALARDRHQQSLEIWERTLGPDHIALAHPLGGLAESFVELGDVDAALVAGRRALALEEAHGQTPSPELLFAIARATWATGDHEGARAVAVRAVEGTPASGPPRPGHVDRETLATWLRDHGDDRRARAPAG